MCSNWESGALLREDEGSELTASDIAAMNDRIAQSAKRLPNVEPGAIRGGAGEATGLGYGTPDVRSLLLVTVWAGRG
jgi:hypothetical protein